MMAGIDSITSALESVSIGPTFTGGKRPDFLSWDDYFMAVACLSAQRSKDPVTQVGAVIVNAEKKIIGIGYNGMPTGIHDDLLPWTKGDPNELNNKHSYVCHAEMNAIMNKNSAEVRGCTIYTSHFPCCECAKLIIQSGITRVVWGSEVGLKGKDPASLHLFGLAKVELTVNRSNRTPPWHWSRARELYSKRTKFIDNKVWPIIPEVADLQEKMLAEAAKRSHH